MSVAVATTTRCAVPACGGENRPVARYCRHCGAELPPVRSTGNRAGSGFDWRGVVGLDEFRREWERLIEGACAYKEKVGKIRRLHSILLGPPGTGKSTLAYVLSQIFHDWGLVTDPRPEHVRAVDFPTTSQDVATLFRKAKGKVLFIDDAHKLIDRGVGGISALDRLVAEMDSPGNDVDPIVLVAGRPGPVRDFLSDHVDVAQRFTRVFQLEEPTLDDLVEMAVDRLARYSLTVDEEARRRLRARLRYLRSEPEDSRQNGHLVVEEVEEIFAAHARRTRGRAGEFGTVRPEDIQEPVLEEQTPEQVLAELDHLVGMEKVRNFIAETMAFAARKREEARRTGVPFVFDDHIVLTGNPGTGKTTVARKLGAVLAAAGLLPTSKVVEVDPSGLIAEHVGGTAQKVHAVCDRAMGGILFIDEAYGLMQSGYGQEAIDTLMKRMSDDKGRFIVVIAGYRKEIDDLLRTNPGLPRRFTRTFHLDDYTPEQLVEIFVRLAQRNGLEVAPEARSRLIGVFRAEASQPNFGNAGFVTNFFRDCDAARVRRVMQTGQDDMTIREEDIPGAVLDPEKALAEATAELEAMIGLASVKEEIRKFERLMRIEILRSGPGGARPTAPHMIFRGNPGTGKTTVARMVGKIFHGLGLLPRGHVVEVSRKDLVAEYVGQTAKRTNDVVDRAMGGILFIDEAYQLVQGGPHDFGREAVEALLLRMSQDAGKFSVIVAGYPDVMDLFLAANEGLARRFSVDILFDDYLPGERAIMFLDLVRRNGLRYGEGFEEAVREYFERRGVEPRGEYANAGGVVKLFEETKKRQAERLVRLQESGESIADRLDILAPDDLPAV